VTAPRYSSAYRRALIRALGVYMNEFSEDGYTAEDFVDFVIVQLDLCGPRGARTFASVADWYEARAKKLRDWEKIAHERVTSKNHKSS
jgi:hypothetical protein